MTVTAMRFAAGTLMLMAAPTGFASAQTFDTVGTRAAGMSGAFVAMADDASAVYWNPGGLASGAYFSLTLDRTETKTGADDQLPAGSRSAFLLSLSAPALGLSYYRLRATALSQPDLAAPAELGRHVLGPDQVHVRTLVTHHAGATLVQSIADGIAVGATLKLVRGIAGTAVRTDGNRDDLLADAGGLLGRATNKFDADVGLMATSSRVRLGLTVRNVGEPEFPTPDGETVLTLERQARAGISVMPLQGWTLAADVDLTRAGGPTGDVRDVAIGLEGQLARRWVGRGGVRLNTLTNANGRSVSASIGGSYAVRGSVLVDGQITMGPDSGARGWGVAARFVY